MKKLLCKFFGRRPREIQLNWEHISSVLIRPIGTGVGDAVVLGAAIAQLRRAYPTCKIGVLTTPRNQFIFQNTTGVDVCLPDVPLTYLREHKKWTVFVDYRPTFTTRNILCDFFLSPLYTICFQKENKKHYSSKTVKNYHFYVPKLAAAHLSQSLSLTPFAPYIDVQDPQYPLAAPAEEQIRFIRPFLRPNLPNVLICPAGSDRMLDKALVQQVLSQLEAATQVHFLLTGAPDSFPLQAQHITYTGTLTLPQFIALCHQADLIISVDTATVHIACAYHKPAVAIYDGRADNFRLFAPLQQPQIVTVRSSQPATTPLRNITQWSVQGVVKAAQSFLTQGGH